MTMPSTFNAIANVNTPTTPKTTSKSSSSAATRNFYQFVCIVSVCIVCYYNSTQCGLVFDDISAIRDNKDLRPSTPLHSIFRNDFWGTPMRKEQSHKSYRPLTVLTFRWNYWLHELKPFGYHFVNVILHIVVCFLFRRVCRLLLLQCAGVDYSCHNMRIATANNTNTTTNSTATAASTNTVPVSRVSVQSTISPQNSCSFIATLLFAIHPIHTEAVTGVVGRAELLSSICFLGAFLTYAQSVKESQSHRTHWFLLVVGFSSWLLASMLCKEQGITIAGICATYELFVVQQFRPHQVWYCLKQLFEEPKADTASTQHPSSKLSNNVPRKMFSVLAFLSTTFWKRLAFLCFITIALLVGRLYIMGSQLPVFTRFDNPASAAETPSRQLTYSYLIYLNSWLLLFPCDLCCDWTMGTVPLIEGFSDRRNVYTLATFLTLIALAACACTTRNRRKSRTLLMCLAWISLPFLPASNLFFPVGFVIAERVLYMPSMGFCMLIAYGYMELQKSFQERRCSIGILCCRLFMITLLLSYGYKTYRRNFDWRSEYTLFMSGLHSNARNAKLFNNVGHALENGAKYQEALLYFQKAVEIQSDDIGAHINVGRTYNNLQMYQQAEEAYLKAKSLFPKIKPGESYQTRIAPNHLNLFINLANLIARNQTRLEEADQLYKQAISMRSDYVQAYINRGDILMKLNRTAQAQEVYEKALLYDSDNADIYYNLGVVHLEQGKSAQAQVYFNKALELYPEHEQALLNSAILLQELGGAENRRLSRDRLVRILAKDEHNEKVYFNLGMLSMDESNFEEAERSFKRAIHIKTDFRSALFNLALLLADANRPLDAVPYLNQLIRHHPDHIKGLILLGDIYINHMKDLDAAEECYRSILKYEPNNVQGLHNLCVVFVERKHLAKARACLKYAHHLAPSEDYILRHLQIVYTRLQKLKGLPDTAAEKVAAFAEYDPEEFKFNAENSKQKSLYSQQSPKADDNKKIQL